VLTTLQSDHVLILSIRCCGANQLDQHFVRVFVAWTGAAAPALSLPLVVIKGGTTIFLLKQLCQTTLLAFLHLLHKPHPTPPCTANIPIRHMGLGWPCGPSPTGQPIHASIHTYLVLNIISIVLHIFPLTHSPTPYKLFSIFFQLHNTL